jgi:ATP-binding cassette, subfamily B, bacterial
MPRRRKISSKTASPDLVDPVWEVHDAELANARFIAMARRLPALVGQAAHLAWQASRLDMAATVTLDLAAGVLTAFGLLATLNVFTALLEGGPTPARVRAALPALVLVGALATARMGVSIGASWAETRLKPQVDREVEKRLFRVTTSVDLAAFENPSFYEALQRARDRGMPEAARVVQLAVSILVAIAALVAAASVLSVLQPVLLPLLLLAALPDAWMTLHIARMRYLTSNELALSRRRKWVLADLMADRRAAAEVRSFSMRDFLLTAYDRLATYQRGVQLRLARREMRITLACDVAAAAAIGLVYVALGVLLNAGMIPLAAAGTAALAIRSGRSSLTALLRAVNQCYESGLYFSDYLDFCEESERRVPPPGTLPAPPAFSTIRATRITFTYPGAKSPALRDVSVEIHQGEVVALVGENGSGKTTLAKILAALYEPSEGFVLWDDLPLRDVRRDDLRRRVAVIMQDYTRWPMTVRENITMGRELNEETLTAAAATAGADHVINDLPSGFETHLDRRFRGGTELSGGQWQRIAIARGFYRDAPLLICDEPTAALDARGEHALFETIRAHGAGRTVLLITHRLASVRHADRIYVLQEGRVVEEGRHSDLLSLGGLYADLYTLQASAYRDTSSNGAKAVLRT